MNTDEYLTEIFRAQLALYRLHLRQHDDEESGDDLKRAETIEAILSLRYPLAKCHWHYERFLEGVNPS